MKQGPGMAIIIGVPKRGHGMREEAPPPFPSRGKAPQSEPMAPKVSRATEGVSHGEAGIPPEAVCYRSEHEVCGNCSFMQSDGTCSRLLIHVEAGAGCNLYESKDEEAMEGDDSGMAAETLG